ncbi:MAG: FAD-dependent oxidoreductase [Candidatus Dormibacteraeota bacterium]|nr:FAD-dependent oxidoreductase [Candidatus Dormibacteraeota bacterium]
MAKTDFDLAIIGAGVVGLFTADFASRQGARVLLLDRSRIGDPRTASFGLTRSIRNDYLDPMYARMAYEARGLWLEFQRGTGESIVIQCGCLNIARADITPALEETYAEQSYRVLKEVGLKAESLNRGQLAARFPQFDADLGRLDIEAGMLHLPPVTAALSGRLHAANVTIEEDTTIKRIRALPDHVTIHTSEGEHVAGHLVLAAGLGTNDLLAATDGCDLRLPLRPDRPSEAKYLLPPPATRELFGPEHLPVFAYLDVGIYGHPWLHGKTPGVKIGYYNPPDARRQETHIRNVLDFVRACLPGLRDAEVRDVEVVDQCSYDLVEDDHFIVGPVPGLPAITIGTGWRGTGYKFSPLMGRTLMELALERRSTIDLSRFSPQRFQVTHAGQD